MKLKMKFLMGAMILCSLSSCISGKKITYFQDLDQLNLDVETAKSSLRIKPDDLLTISVAARNIESVQVFNLPVIGMPSQGDPTRVGGTPQLQTFLVDSEGNIEFPILGKVHVLGLNRQELSALLKEKIEPYVENPIVNVRIVNFQVTVLGEVNQPGTYSIPDEYLSLNKALGFAGDLTIYGKRENVLIIREENGEKTYNYLDLTSSSSLQSPFYYLQQNDVVYVEPNNAQKQSAAYNRNASVYISIASVLISLAILITR